MDKISRDTLTEAQNVLLSLADFLGAVQRVNPSPCVSATLGPMESEIRRVAHIYPLSDYGRPELSESTRPSGAAPRPKTAH